MELEVEKALCLCIPPSNEHPMEALLNPLSTLHCAVIVLDRPVAQATPLGLPLSLPFPSEFPL